MNGDNLIVLATLIAYKLVLVGVGVWASRRNRTEGDFFLASQGLGAWVAGLSYAASTSSAWVLLGFSGFVYANGLSALWMVPGIWGGYVAVWLFFGRRLRAETAERGHVTPTDFLTAGLADRSRGMHVALLIQQRREIDRKVLQSTPHARKGLRAKITHALIAGARNMGVDKDRLGWRVLMGNRIDNRLLHWVRLFRLFATV